MSDKPFVLVDGSSYLFRAFYALPNLTGPDGMPTGAILGVMNMLQRLIDDIQPEYIAVVFDAKGKTFRHQRYDLYKANRSAMPQELAVQIEPLHKMIESFGLPLVIESGVEADDVIGTLATQAASEGQHVLVSTGDKDIAQLVNEQITLIDTMKNVVSDVNGVKAKFGVMPNQMIDYLTLIGDTADNIPGVPKVGPKTAVKWLDQYQTLDNLIEHAHEIGGKVGENFRDFLDHIPLSKDLVTIVCDVPLSERWRDLKRQRVNVQTLLPQLQKWNFKSWIKQYSTLAASRLAEPQNLLTTEKNPVQAPHSTVKQGAQTDCMITTAEALSELVSQLSKAKAISFDTETTNLDEMKAELVGFSFAAKGLRGVYIPTGHTYLGAPNQLALEVVLAHIKPLLENPDILKIAHHLKYDAKVLARYHIDIQNPQYDTMLASYVLEAGFNRHDMDTLAQKHLGIQTIRYEDVAGKGAKAIVFSDVPVEAAAPYAAEDAQVTFELYEYFEEKLNALPELKGVFETIEMPVVQVLSAMERCGVLIDTVKLAQQSADLQCTILKLQQQAFSLAGQEFNLGSPKQLQEILFDKMQIPVIKKTPTGQASTSEDVMQELAENYELPAVILEFRHLSKLKSTYTDKLPKEVNAKTGRVHTHYMQTGAATGRLSSHNPNLQNIPVRTQEGRKIRQAFIAQDGYQLLAADYSQVELRIMAHLSGDKGLVDAFAQNQDVHRATASEVFGVTKDQVTSDQRRHAKAINFGLMYGMSAFGLAKQLNISRSEAKAYIDIYFERYPGVADFMVQSREKAKALGYVETVYGRRLYLPAIQSSNGAQRAGAERAAINAPMQGTAADIIKKAMIALHQKFHSDPEVNMIMQVHDELVFEVKESRLAAVTETVKQMMEAAGHDLSVPLVVDIGVGHNWDEAH